MNSSTTYDEILKVYNNDAPDDFFIHCEQYYEMFSEEGLTHTQLNGGSKVQ